MPTPIASSSAEQLVRSVFSGLYESWGPQHWWPAETPFEVVIGAFLTQNTAWTNVSRAITNLRHADKLTLAAIREVPVAELEQLVRPAGYFRQKAGRLKNFVAFLDSQYNGSFERLFAQPTADLRRELLALNGVGPETADSILLYAGSHPVFVVDAYTRRIVDRHALMRADADYEEIRALFERALHELPEGSCQPATELGSATASGTAHLPSVMSTCERTPLAQIYNEMHALIVGVGKNHCFKGKPSCDGCPLARLLPATGPGDRNQDESRRRTTPRNSRTV